MSNATLFTADRATHQKVVVVALMASIILGLCAIGLRVAPANHNQAQQLLAAGYGTRAGG